MTPGSDANEAQNCLTLAGQVKAEREVTATLTSTMSPAARLVIGTHLVFCLTPAVTVLPELLDLPIVDVGLLLSANAEVAFRTEQAITSACMDYGLFAAEGAASPAATTDALNAHAEVFSVHPDERASSSRPGFARGFIPLGGESGSRENLECKGGRVCV